MKTTTRRFSFLCKTNPRALSTPLRKSSHPLIIIRITNASTLSPTISCTIVFFKLIRDSIMASSIGLLLTIESLGELIFYFFPHFPLAGPLQVRESGSLSCAVRYPFSMDFRFPTIHGNYFNIKDMHFDIRGKFWTSRVSRAFEVLLQATCFMHLPKKGVEKTLEEFTKHLTLLVMVMS